MVSIRVITYNVLSTQLASPSHFTTLPPAHLPAQSRLPYVLRMIESEIGSHNSNNSNVINDNENTNTRCIVCLQEVSYEWAGSFHTFFANRGYHMVTGLYGRKFNGYMGVALAWPIQMFDTLHVDMSRVADTRIGGWPESSSSSSQSGWLIKSLEQLKSTVVNITYPWTQRLMKFITASPNNDATSSNSLRDSDPWQYAASRMNVVLTATLRDKESGHVFCIGTYHMPCIFWDTRVMTLHADLCLAHVQRVATQQQQQQQQCSRKDSDRTPRHIPYILAGDFNIKPVDAVYNLLTTGVLASNIDTEGEGSCSTTANPGTKAGVTWVPTMIEPVRSAYKVAMGSEPDFTNYARIREEDPFIDTLDYIFISPTWIVDEVKPLMKREDAGGPFPNLDRGEPSDHILIAATLTLNEE